MSFMNPKRARLSTACVSRVLLSESFSTFIVACKQKGCMVISVRNHVRSAIDHFLLQAHVKFREFRPMNPGMLMVLEVKTYVEHRQVEKVRHKYSGMTYRLGGSLLDASRMLDIHARTHHERVGDPVRQHPEPQSHSRIDPKRN